MSMPTIIDHMVSEISMFQKYNNVGRDLNGFSVNNPKLYRWWYWQKRVDETPLFGSKVTHPLSSKKACTQVGLEEIRDMTVDVNNSLTIKEIARLLTPFLLKLKPREERYIRERFFNNKNRKDIGISFNVTYGRLWQIEKTAVRKLKMLLEKDPETMQLIKGII